MRIHAITRAPISYTLWNSERNGRMCSLIVKGTYSFARDVITLADRQEALSSCEVPSESSDPVICALATSDRAPFKQYAEVVVWSSNASGTDLRTSNARLSVGDIDKVLQLDAGVEAWPPRAHLIRQGVNPFERPGEIDATYFNVAPHDQQLSKLETDARVVLENLVPGRPLCVLRLPGHQARALVDSGNFELPLQCDTLWIDLALSTFTITWRGNFRVGSISTDDRIIVDLETGVHGTSRDEMRGAAVTREIALSPDVWRATTPTSGMSASWPSPSPEVRPPAPRQERTVEFQGPTAVDSAIPFWGAVTSARGDENGSARAAARPHADPQAPVAAPERLERPVFSTREQSKSAWGSGMGLAALQIEPKPQPSSLGHLGHDKAAAARGAAGASDAAARKSGDGALDNRVAGTASKPAAGPLTFVDLLWFDPASPERVRSQTRWADQLSAGPAGAKWLREAEAIEAAKSAAPPERTLGRALTRIPPLDAAGIARAVRDAVDEDGLLIRPLVVVEGDLSVAFDRLEVLRATLAFAEPLARTDKKLKETLDAMNEIAAGDARVHSPQYDTSTQRVRVAFQAANKVYPAGYLEKGVERAVLEHRDYATRTVLGQEKLVAQIDVRPGEAITTYLPADLRGRLPLLPRFKVRVIAEPHAQQALGDGDDIVLVAIALARVITRP